MMKVNADLHNHLRTLSDMSCLDFNEVADIASQRLGEYGIFGIVNFNDERYEQFSNLKGYERINLTNGFYIPGKKLLVVKGQEVPTKQGHLFVLGIRKGKHLQPGKDLESIIKDALDNNGIIVADHLFYRDGLGNYLQKNPTSAGLFDALEIYDSEAELWIPGILPKKANERAREFYEQVKKDLDVGALFSSDGHSIAEIGRSYTQLEMPGYNTIKNSEDLVECLRKAIRGSKLPFGKIESSKFRALIHAGILALLNVSKIGGVHRN